MRGATVYLQLLQQGLEISIHAPHAGRDSHTVFFSPFQVRFQSTRPMRGATTITGYNVWFTEISIHAPHAGRDS